MNNKDIINSYEMHYGNEVQKASFSTRLGNQRFAQVVMVFRKVEKYSKPKRKAFSSYKQFIGWLVPVITVY